MQRRLLCAVTSIFLAIAATLAVHVSPAAAATCYDITCMQYLGGTQGCQDDAYVQASFQVQGTDPAYHGEGDLWYSRACHAVWGEFYTTDPASEGQFALWLSPELGGRENAQVLTVTGTGDYRTKMVPWNNSVKVCTQHNNEDPATRLPDAPGGVCTGWR
jgi:hypothetical protein